MSDPADDPLALASRAGLPSEFLYLRDAFPRERWSHVKLVYDGSGKQEMFVNGELFGTKDAAFKATVQKPLILSFGPFRGMVDEVIVRKGNQ